MDCGLVMPYGDMYGVIIGSGNSLLPDGTKPLPERMLTQDYLPPFLCNFIENVPDKLVNIIIWN